jgi:ATP-dependent DNA helicase RecG
MITPDDIKLLVASGEGFNTEFKVSVPSKVKEISEEVCAFANAAGALYLLEWMKKMRLKG